MGCLIDGHDPVLTIPSSLSFTNVTRRRNSKKKLLSDRIISGLTLLTRFLSQQENYEESASVQFTKMCSRILRGALEQPNKQHTTAILSQWGGTEVPLCVYWQNLPELPWSSGFYQVLSRLLINVRDASVYCPWKICVRCQYLKTKGKIRSFFSFEQKILSASGSNLLLHNESHLFLTHTNYPCPNTTY